MCGLSFSCVCVCVLPHVLVLIVYILHLHATIKFLSCFSSYLFFFCTTLARSLYPSPLLFTGDSSRQEVHAPSSALNNVAASPAATMASSHHPQLPLEDDPLGPLPDNWEMAYTETGEVYFIE